MLKVVFMGTPDFAVPSLDALVKAGFEVTVFTQPDKPAGRGNKMSVPEVKRYALEHNVPVYQFDKVRCDECLELLKQIAPDIMVTAAFGQILTKQILDIPRLGCVNVHASLLPKYRGSAPIQWAIIKGEKITGITTMLTDIGLDTGDILLKQELEISQTDTAESMFGKLSVLGAEVLINTIEGLLNNEITPVKQDESVASYYPMIKKSMAKPDFSQSAQQVDCFIRGMYSWPMAFIELDEGIFKVHKAHMVEGDHPVGCVCTADSTNGLMIGCGSGAISLDIIQAQGGKAMKAVDYLRGHRIAVGQQVK